MNPIKAKILEEIMEKMAELDGHGLKSKIDELKQPKEEAVSLDDQDPKGLEVSKVKVLGEPELDKDPMDKPELSDLMKDDKSPEDLGDEKEMSDEELEEMLSKYLS